MGARGGPIARLLVGAQAEPIERSPDHFTHDADADGTFSDRDPRVRRSRGARSRCSKETIELPSKRRSYSLTKLASGFRSSPKAPPFGVPTICCRSTFGSTIAAGSTWSNAFTVSATRSDWRPVERSTLSAMRCSKWAHATAWSTSAYAIEIGAAIKGLAVWQRLLQEVEKRQSAERLYERMASLGRLTAGIAHGMNTPVAAVRAALQHLSSLVEEYRSGVGDAALTPADHQEVAREMAVSIKAANSASTRVAEFLRSIRLQTREGAPVEASLFDAVTVVRDTLLLLDHAIRVGECVVEVTSSGDRIELLGIRRGSVRSCRIW